MVKVSFNVVLSANKACKPDNWPACLAIPLHATLQNQKSKSLKAKSQKQTATCQSHSSEFGLCEPETAWVSDGSLSLSLLLYHLSYRIWPVANPHRTTLHFLLSRNQKNKNPKKWKQKIVREWERDYERVKDSCFLVQSYSLSVFNFFFLNFFSLLGLHTVKDIAYAYLFFSAVCSNFLASSCPLHCFYLFAQKGFGPFSSSSSSFSIFLSFISLRVLIVWRFYSWKKRETWVLPPYCGAL